MHTAKLKKLLRNINDSDPSVRRSAAEELSGGDERAIYPLIKALRDDNFGVQDAAMRSLMEIKGEITAYMVLPLLRENSFLRNTALIIIKEIGKSSVPLLYTLLNEQDDDIRKFALDLIHDIQYCNYPEKLVELLTGDHNANVRASAAKTLGKLKYNKALPQLINALNDDEWVCFSAIESLTELKDPTSVKHIVKLLESPSEATRFASIESLGNIGSPDAAKPLIDNLQKAEGFERKAIIKSLLQIGSVPSREDISETLLDILINDEWEDKIIAINGLKILDDARAIPYMIDLAGSFELSDPDYEEKKYLIREAVQSFSSMEPLVQILYDDNAKFRGKSFAIEIAGDLKCKEAVSALIKLLKSEYRDIRRSSINSLSKIEGDEVQACLIDAITDHDSHVRKTAVISLGRICEISAFEPLMKMLQKEQYADVIDEFVCALININSTLFLSRIDEFSDNIKEVAAKYTSGFKSEVSC
jgi:HEAT repeat protein